MMPRPAACLAVMLPVLMVVAPAPAAELPPPPTDEDGYIETGPFHVKPSLTLKDVGYDSNIFLTPESKSDYTATLEPALSAVMLFGHRGRFDVRPSLELVGFKEYSSLNYANSHIDTTWQVLFGDFRYKGDLDLSSEKLRPSDELDQRVRLENSRLAGEVLFSRSEQASLFVRAEGQNLDYGDDSLPGRNDVRDLNRDEITYTVGGQFRIRPKTDTIVELRREDYQFREDPTRNARAWRFVPGLELDGNALDSSLELGYMDFDADDPGRSDYSGVVGEAKVSLRTGPRLRWTAGFERDVVFSIFGDNLYFRSQKARLEVSTPLSRRVRLEVGGLVGTNEWPDAVSFGTFQDLRHGDIRAYWIGGSYEPPGARRFGLRVRYRERDSNYDPADDDQLQILGNAAYTF